MNFYLVAKKRPENCKKNRTSLTSSPTFSVLVMDGRTVGSVRVIELLSESCHPTGPVPLDNARPVPVVEVAVPTLEFVPIGGQKTVERMPDNEERHRTRVLIDCDF